MKPCQLTQNQWKWREARWQHRVQTCMGWQRIIRVKHKEKITVKDRGQTVHMGGAWRTPVYKEVYKEGNGGEVLQWTENRWPASDNPDSGNSQGSSSSHGLALLATRLELEFPRWAWEANADWALSSLLKRLTQEQAANEQRTPGGTPVAGQNSQHRDQAPSCVVGQRV